MKKTAFLTALLALCAISLQAQPVTVTVSNPTAAQRQELVAIDASQLPFPAKEGVIVRDAFGIERVTQLTRDGQLLLYVHVRPHGKSVFTIQSGIPAAIRSWVGGRQYPERLDDIAFENDRIGFRLYGPALQRRGEKGYGHDVWVKRTTELIVDELYRNNPKMSFHLDYDKGLDCFAVGPTLGCGTPAIVKDGQLVFPWCYETYEILENGPLRFRVQVNFPKNTDGITEHRLLTLDRGSNFCEALVWYDGMKKPADIVAGFGIRPADTTSIVKGKDYVHYADPTIDPERHQTQIYVALVFPDQQVEITTMQQHGVGMMKGYQSGQRFHYYFGAAWSEFDVRSQDEWQVRVQSLLQAKRHPLQVAVSK